MTDSPHNTPGQSSRAAEAAKPLSKADLHMHTNLGDGTASPQRVLDEAKRRNLKVIAITDHDHMEGAKRVQDLIERTSSDIEMIWGCEVTTREGHFLGLFMKRPVKFLCRIEAAIEGIKEQGGITVIPHPLGRLVPSVSRRKIDELLERGFPARSTNSGASRQQAAATRISGSTSARATPCIPARRRPTCAARWRRELRARAARSSGRSACPSPRMWASASGAW